MGTVEITNAANNSVTVRAVAYPLRRVFTNARDGVWFDPSDLDTLFQDSAGSTPVTAVGDPVGRMEDKSGNDHHVTQGTDSKRPVLRKDSNGNRYLEFDGVDDVLLASGFSFGASGLSMFCAAAPSQSSSLECFLVTEDGNEDRTFVFVAVENNTEGESRFPGGSIERLILESPTSGDTHIFSLLGESGDVVGRLDATEQETGTGFPERNVDNLAIGAQRSGIRFNAVNHYQIVIVATKLSTDDRDAVENELAWLSGVTL